MSAPEAVVRRVQEALGCSKVNWWYGDPWECEQHEGPWADRGCPEALLAADAAFTASLEWAADEADGDRHWPTRHSTASRLRRLAGDS